MQLSIPLVSGFEFVFKHRSFPEKLSVNILIFSFDMSDHSETQLHGWKSEGQSYAG